jgi:cyclase
MLPKRIIPVFLFNGKRLVKGRKFKDHIDVGNPISQGMIYDAQGADEIIIVDILASQENRMINPSIINDMINKCRLPIAAGGGIKSIGDAQKCFDNGADKIVINTHASNNQNLIKKMANEFGSQSIIVSIDVRKEGDNYIPYVLSGSEKVDKTLKDLVDEIISNEPGEILLTSIDREGTLSGFDLALYSQFSDINIPFIASGGAGSYDHIVDLFKKTTCDAAGLGKMLFLRDYDIVRIKAYLTGRKIFIRDA